MKGLDYLTVTVDEISTEGLATVIDQFGNRKQIRADLQRAKAPRPHVGEIWVIDQALGYWTFAAVITPTAPVITGERDANPALTVLLDQFEAAGLLVDQTIEGTQPSGGGGVLTGVYAYTQVTPSAVWTVTHNLGYHPSVTVVDSAGTVVVGDVVYVDVNQLTVTFSGAFSGLAYLS